jgi:hypothetical protein
MNFERFDEHARAAVIVAGEQAVRAGRPEVGVDQLALGVLHELDGRAFERLARELERGEPGAGRLPFSAGFTAALEDARSRAPRVTIAELAAAAAADADLSEPAREALAKAVA